ncbi:hypothetical protein GCM10022406_26540 [Hymenobacter algoricola]|uniref:XRE family transcriptional regulator n=2 Tax=Hymenobacter algoricola TaxID=486267 RepID=A0ABP7NAJ3_9BACT
MRQDELALYAGVSPELIQAAESGRRSMSTPLLMAMLPLLQQLPEAAAPASEPPIVLPALAAGSPAPDAAALDFRRRQCQQQAGRLRTQADKLATRARAAERWAQVLPALLAAHPPPTDPADEYAAARHVWLMNWLPRRTRPLPTDDVTRWHLLQARIVALEAEAAALAAVAPD